MSGRSDERRRIDVEMVARGLADSRARAQDLIRRGHVRLDGEPVGRPSQTVGADQTISLAETAPAWVSRAAEKLVAGLDAFGLNPSGRLCLDLGASTGGFTEVLLARGAAHVVAIDVGHGQLHPRIAADPRVVSVEGLNARDLTAEQIGVAPGFLVADVSFISLTLALPPALPLCTPRAEAVVLVKPQFEVGREGIGSGGIGRDARLATAAAERIASWLDGRDGWHVLGLVPSPIEGGDGNREFLLGARRDGAPA